MMGRRLCNIAVAVGFVFTGSAATAKDGFVQDQAQFRAALESGSTSPSFVLLTVVDTRSGTRATGCTSAPFLLSALAVEQGIERRDWHGRLTPDVRASVLREAAMHRDHVYTFRKPAALANVPLDARGSDRACEIIRSGLPAYRQDRSGQVLAGTP